MRSPAAPGDLSKRPDDLLAAAQERLAEKRWSEALRCIERALDERPQWIEALALALYAASKLEYPDVFRKHARTTLDLPPRSRPRLSDKKVGNLALAAGAHDVAAQIGRALIASERGVGPGSYLLASATWEAGEESAAEQVISDALARGGAESERAAIDYRLRLDDVDGAAVLLRASEAPDACAAVAVAEAFQAQGNAVRAHETVGWARSRGLSAPRLDAVESAAGPLRSLIDGSWLPRKGADEREGPRRSSGCVLHLVTRSLPYYTTGGSVRTQYVARAQRDAGLNAVVATSLGFPWSDGEVPASRTTEVDGVTYHHIGSEAVLDVPLDERLRRTVEALLPLADELRPAVLHPASDYRNALVALALGRRLGIPVVYEVRGFPEERLRRRPGSRAWMDRSVARRELERRCALAADHVVTLGSAMKEHLVARGVPAAGITIVPNGVDSSVFAPMPRDRRLAARLGIDRAETVIGYVSSFKAFEGIETILEATARLRSRGKPVRALLVGGGDQEEPLRRRARELDIESQVTFAGRVAHADVPRYYALIDIFVCPRRAETTSELVTPLKPFEAMAMECAVIVSRTQALREIVEDGVTGRTFTPEDSAELAAVCAKLIERLDERGRLAAAGRAWVIANRSWSGHGWRYRNLYEKLGVTVP